MKHGVQGVVGGLVKERKGRRWVWWFELCADFGASGSIALGQGVEMEFWNKVNFYLLM